MKQFYISIILLILAGCVYCQKAIINEKAIMEWPSLGSEKMSPNGKYILYKIRNQPVGVTTICIQSTDQKWSRRLTNGESILGFTADSKYCLYTSRKGDSLYFLATGGDIQRSISGIFSVKFLNENNDLLLFKMLSKKNDIVIEEVASGKKTIYENVDDYALSEKVKIIIQRLIDGKRALSFAQLPNGEETHVYTTKSKLGSINFDVSERQLVFAEGEGEHIKIFYWNADTRQAFVKVDAGNRGIDKEMMLSPQCSFTDDGKYIELSLIAREEKFPERDSRAVKVNLWSYADPRIQSLQEGRPAVPFIYKAAVRSQAIKEDILQLTKFMELAFYLNDGKNWLIRTSSNDPVPARWDDRFWLKRESESYLLTYATGQRKSIPIQGLSTFYSQISSRGKFICFYDLKNENYYSYETATGRLRNLTGSFPKHQFRNASFKTNSTLRSSVGQYTPVSGSKWLEDESGVVVYDLNDIWLLDPTGQKAPLNLTNGYGKKHGISFKILEADATGSLRYNENVLLVAFDLLTKQNGFYQMSFGELADPVKLTMGDCMYYHPSFDWNTVGEVFTNNTKPKRASNNNVWILRRQSYDAFPNLYVTSDFQSFDQQTMLAPEKSYNWYSTELINFILPDGTKNQGVLYKPENFDPSKKYPVIINYYNQTSYLRFGYVSPKRMQCSNIDVPYYVSRGYLVFETDIYYSANKRGESAAISVNTAADALAKLPYVDRNRMGISGHSNGGALSNYIMTHSNKFAAVFTGSGATDPISLSLGIGHYSKINQGGDWMMDGELTHGKPIWGDLSGWLKSSAIMSADKITGPVLIFHNKHDSAPWEQGLAMYLALRRLDKPCWMLDYDDEGHGVDKPENIKDLTARSLQFFDHYLKGAPAPQWMIKGIPFKYKNVESGLNLDPTGSCGKDCTVCKKWVNRTVVKK